MSSKGPSSWADLSADPRIAAALAQVGPQPINGTQNEKRKWSEQFANHCAVIVATAFRATSVKSKIIRPESLSSGTEPLTPLGSGTKKRIDVTVADPVLGLEIGVSLKSSNFADGQSGNFDKNLTGRLYELGDEVRVVHEHLPHAFMAAMWFMPLGATADKQKGNSSFANTVIKLRERRGRLDASLLGHAGRCDAAYVALYTLGNELPGLPAGAVRLFDVQRNPPRRGRPLISSTMSLEAAVLEIVNEATFAEQVAWGPAEP